MAEVRVRFPSSRGRLYYTPGVHRERRGAATQSPVPVQRRRRIRPSLISVNQARSEGDVDTCPRFPRRSPSPRKLAVRRDSALRFLRSAISTHPSKPHEQSIRSAAEDSQTQEPSPRQSCSAEAETMLSADLARPPPPAGATTGQRPSVVSLPDSRRGSTQSNASARKKSSAISIADEKPVAVGNGVSVSVNLAEPYLYLQGYDENDRFTRNTAMLRGSLHLRITKNAKLKSVSLGFKGTAITKWPEGIPPKKIETEETNTLMSHTWPFFNAQFPSAEDGSGADRVLLAGPSEKHGSPYLAGSPVSSSVNITSRDAKRLHLSVNQSRSFDKSEAKFGPTTAQRGYRTFYPGEYIYNFELPIDSRMPESIDVDLGSVKYELEATVERAGAFRTNLNGKKEVVMIRAPSEGSLEQVEPIAISRNWEDQLHYDIVISGKSFPLGAKVPIAFKLTPLAKVQCHRIKVFVTENVEYFCSHKRVHRMEPTRKILLFEKRSDQKSASTFEGSSMRVTAGGGVPYDQRQAAANGTEVTTSDPANLLGRLDQNAPVGPTEMELSVQLPGCQAFTEKEKMNKLHFDTTYQNIQVHHWIKIVMRLSKPDENDPSKRRHFEISIDSPFHILSCRATQANTSLPAYSSPDDGNPTGNLADCGCPGAPRRRISPTHVPTLNNFNNTSRNNSVSSASDETASSSTTSVPALARPQQAHLDNSHAVQRPIHMLRAPSFNPPSFDEEEPPPPLITPPPQYNDIASPSSGLTDYFSRFADAYDEESSSEDDRTSTRRGRVNVPLTPGSRVNRSFDGQRTWTTVS